MAPADVAGLDGWCSEEQWEAFARDVDESWSPWARFAHLFAFDDIQGVYVGLSDGIPSFLKKSETDFPKRKCHGLLIGETIPPIFRHGCSKKRARRHSPNSETSTWRCACGTASKN